ncbi:MAG: hypothetical protein ABIQ31_13970 [Ferruginibacter sp.]
MIRLSKILFALNVICLAPLLSSGQDFKFTAELGAVDTTGFYAIPILSKLSAYIRTDFADIRIADKNKRWVPHIIQQGKSPLMEDLFTAFPIMQNTVTDSGKNLLVIENTRSEGIYNLKLFLKNSAVSRTAMLSGSNDQHDWFIIDDKIAISRSYEMVKDEYLQEINFPLTKYRYLKIIIDNMHNDPLQVTRAGFYAQPYKKSTNYEDNPAPTFTQKDSGNYSYVEVRQPGNYHFDKISLSISGSKFYNRDLQICYPDFGKNNIAKPGLIMGSFKLLSALPATFELPRTKTALFFIVIKNADNPPLKVDKVYTQQQTVSLITYLEQGKKYDLLMNDSLASFADYDLQTFKDSITMIRPLNYTNVHAIEKAKTEHTAGNKNQWIWPVIIFAGLVLSFLTYRLIADMNKSKK